jgi:hypothetical protein
MCKAEGKEISRFMAAISIRNQETSSLCCPFNSFGVEDFF